MRRPAPIVRKAIRQPNAVATPRISVGAIKAPSAAPLLKMPLAMLRSAGGNMLATIRDAQGQLNVSPMPNTARVTMSVGSRYASAAAAPASDHKPTARPNVVRSGR